MCMGVIPSAMGLGGGSGAGALGGLVPMAFAAQQRNAAKKKDKPAAPAATGPTTAARPAGAYA